MQETNSENTFSFKNLGLQDYLYIGYAFLLVLGLFHETIYYKFLGVNILDFSSLLDVLICPVSVITGNLILGLALLFCALVLFIVTKLLPKYYESLSKKEKYQSGKKKEKLDKAIESFKSKNATITLGVFYVFCLYVGLGIGRGIGTKRKLNQKKIKLTHELVFDDGEKQEIKMLGKNSLYVFYVTQEKREVVIAPIEGNIKKMSKLKKE